MMNAAKELLTFIENSPSMFHSIETIKGMLDEAGFTYLPERTCWDVKQGGTYYTIRNHCVPRRKGTGRLPFPDVRLPQ